MKTNWLSALFALLMGMVTGFLGINYNTGGFWAIMLIMIGFGFSQNYGNKKT